LVDFKTKVDSTKSKLSSKSTTKALRAIAQQVSTVPEAASVADALDKAKAGTARRRAVTNAYQWCTNYGAFRPTSLTVPPSIEAVDTDVVPVAGTTEPGAHVVATGNNNVQNAEADGTGAFSFGFPNLPLDQTVSVNIMATLSPRPPARATTTVKRTISEGAYKAQAQSPPYGELVKGGLQGQTVTYRTKVFQFDTATGPDTFLGYVTPGSYDIWNDVAMFKLSDPALGNGVVNDNVVRVWGTVGPPQSYSTRIGGSNTVPVINVKYLTKQ
jgi:hypothetical protein